MIAFSNNDKWAFCDHFIRFKLNKELVLPSYLSNYFSTKIARNYIKFNMVSSAGQNTISQKTLASLPIALPGITEQEAIVNEFGRLSSISEAIVNTLGESFKFSDRLRQSILKLAFEGRLVPQNPNDEPASMLLERIKAERSSQVHKSTKRERLPNTHQMRLTQ
jgi:type I restriction enzyme S subunit